MLFIGKSNLFILATIQKIASRQKEVGQAVIKTLLAMTVNFIFLKTKLCLVYTKRKIVFVF